MGVPMVSGIRRAERASDSLPPRGRGPGRGGHRTTRRPGRGRRPSPETGPDGVGGRGPLSPTLPRKGGGSQKMPESVGVPRSIDSRRGAFPHPPSTRFRRSRKHGDAGPTISPVSTRLGDLTHEFVNIVLAKSEERRHLYGSSRGREPRSTRMMPSGTRPSIYQPRSIVDVMHSANPSVVGSGPIRLARPERSNSRENHLIATKQSLYDRDETDSLISMAKITEGCSRLRHSRGMRGLSPFEGPYGFF